MKYYDIHTHYTPVNPSDVAIVNRIVRIDMKLPEDWAGDWYSYGIHPWYIEEDTEKQLTILKDVVNHPEVVAIGEAGLDKKAAAPMETQQSVFLSQAQLAEEIGKPLIIHCVKAWQELIVCRKKIRPQMPWIIHGFRGKEKLAAQLIHAGFILSFGLRFHPEAAKTAWPDNLLLETDEAAVDIRLIYQQMAKTLSIPVVDLVAQITRNVMKSRTFKRYFTYG